jgi:hypothetical protein
LRLAPKPDDCSAPARNNKSCACRHIIRCRQTQCSNLPEIDARERRMKTCRLMSLQFGVLLILIASLQYRSMSPRLYSFLETTAVLIGTTTMFEGMPANAFDWSY